MPLRSCFVLVALLIVSSLHVGAQDIHFSQYFASPLTLNPAMTGNFGGDFRVTANYRNQWFGQVSNNAPFETYSGSFDISVLRDQLNNDQLGVGLMVYSDKAGDGNLSTQSAMASAAYHKSLDNRNKYQLTVGVQGGIVQKRIDFSKLKFEEQYNGDGGFNTALDNKEQVESNTLLYPDFNIGLQGQAMFSENVNAHVGFGHFHMFSPNESFLKNDDNKVEPRTVAHGGVNVAIGEYFGLSPGFLYMHQANANELTVGSAFRYMISQSASAYLGAWHRLQDAVIPYAGFEIEGVRVGVSYDFTVSNLATAANHVGGFEISAVYVHNAQPPQELNPTRYCPRF